MRKREPIVLGKINTNKHHHHHRNKPDAVEWLASLLACVRFISAQINRAFVLFKVLQVTKDTINQ